MRHAKIWRCLYKDVCPKFRQVFKFRNLKCCKSICNSEFMAGSRFLAYYFRNVVLEKYNFNFESGKRIAKGAPSMTIYKPLGPIVRA